MKKGLCAIIAIILCISSSPVQAKELKNYTDGDLLSLYSYQGFAYRSLKIDSELNLLGVKSQEDSVKSLKNQMEQAEKDYKRYKDHKDEDKQENVTKAYHNAITSYYKGVKELELKKYNEKVFDDNLNKKKDKIALDFKKRMFGITNLENQLNVLKLQLNNQQKSLVIAEKQLELNLISQMDLEKTQLQVKELEQSYKSTEKQLTILKKNLCFELGIEETDAFSITYKDVVTEPLKLDLKRYVEGYLKNNQEGKALAYEIELQEALVKSLSDLLPKGHKNLVHSQNQLKQLQLKADELAVNNEINAINTYYSYEKVRDQYFTLVEKDKVAMQQYEEMTVMHKQGKISDLDYASATISKENSKVALTKGLFDYQQSLEELTLSLTGSL